ncbi:MAG: xanthine dehydrogenase family protein molybdopterin-binding subunit [Candidimonas sp.]|nr:MAG: xanthine dehydrogenase family protein molybdopterin-binding subunit [Candidimonas sp.]
MTTTLHLSRRQLLKTGGALLVGFPLGAAAPLALADSAHAAGGQPKNFKTTQAWLAIDGDGRVTVYSGHVELGTGVETALTQMSADELDVPFNAIRIVQGDTWLTPDQGPTWGSLTVQVAGQQIRKAAACARRALLDAASRKLGAPATSLAVADGVISHDGKHIAYGQLARGGRVLDVPFDDAVPLKQAGAFKVVGKPVARVDIPAKVTGEFTYMQDFRLRGMLHGRVIRPAGMQARLLSVDDSAARRIPGFVRTVVKGNFVGVVAKTEWSAIRAMGAVKCKWSDWAGLPAMDDVYEAVKRTPVKQTQTPKKEGDVDHALAAAAKTLRATYEYPVQTHGSIGPSCSVADVRRGYATIWSASQSTHWTQRQIAAMLGMKPEQVRIFYLEGAGCYGRNGHEDATADAVLLSQAIGRPVRVQWMRADEHGWDPKAPPYVADLRGGLDEHGNVVAWDFVTWLPYSVGMTDVPLLARSLEDGDAGVQKVGNMMPGNMQSDAFPPYAVPNVLSTIQRVETTPFRPSWLRGPGRMQNTYANECFMDELAASAHADPVAFRLKHLKDERGAACIDACAKKAGWDARPSPRQNISGDKVTGRGFTYVFYDNKRTYVSAVCDVEVDRASGHVRATRFVIAHDCGLIINPDGLKAQIEGSVVQTLSRTLLEEVKWNASHVTSLDWESYPILTFPEVPKIEIVLIDRPDQPAWGAGEPTCAVIPSALANAIFDATGVRLRRAPFTPQRVKQALNA